MEEEQSRQVRFLIVIAGIVCAIMIGYNAFYVPEVPLSEPAISTDIPSKNANIVSAAGVDEKMEAYVPSSAAAVFSSAAKKNSVSSSARKVKNGKKAGKVNINKAPAQQMSEQLDGIGESLAARIVDYRNKHGPFRSVEEIKNVSGIGEKKYKAISNSITVK